MSQSPPDRSSSSQPEKSRHRQLPYRVVLLRDAEQALMCVVRAVMDVTHLCREEATFKMWESYHSGKSQLLVTHQERAELYVDQFADHGVTVTIEPVVA